MRIFELQRDELAERGAFRYDIVATHPYCLPGFTCPACQNVWATVGAAFPAIDLSAQPWAKRMDSDVVSAEEYQELRELVLPFLPPGADPQPGWEFGRLTGRARGKVGDCAWVTSWTMLMRQSAIEKLIDLGVRMPVHVKPDLRWRSPEPPEDLFELQVEPMAEVSPASYRTLGAPCSVCGRSRRKLLKLVVEASSVPKDIDVFRPKYYSAFILATERFVEAARELNLTGLVCANVEVV